MTWGAARTPLADYLMSGVAHRKGEHEVSRNHLRAALDKVRWDKRTAVLVWKGHSFYEDDALPMGAVYVIAAEKRVIVSSETWTTLGFDGEALRQFMSDMVEGSGGMKFLTLDAGPYARAVVKEAEKMGTNIPARSELLNELAVEADSLLTQAAGLQHATPVQLQIFSVRYAELAEKMDAAEAEFKRVRALVDLAGAAVADL